MIESDDFHTQVECVPIDRLHERLGLVEPVVLPAETLTRSLADWRGEIDDAAILSQVYRQWSPRRHLEFGTWKGDGTVLCLKNCDATVWTVNLWDGEIHADGENEGGWCYAEPVEEGKDYRDSNVVDFEVSWVQTDARGQIGRHIHEAGLGHRVCQVYADSKQWDTAHYPPSFFDSVLVDGGHQPDVVASDTRKALSLLRSGGLMMWHDFCLDEQVAADYNSVQGVRNGLHSMWDEVLEACRDVFWVKPSWLLMGIKR